MVEKISIYPATLLYSNGQSNWFPDYFIIIIIIIITVEPPCTTTSLKRPLTLHIWDGITGIIIIMQYKTKECEL